MKTGNNVIPRYFDFDETSDRDLAIQANKILECYINRPALLLINSSDYSKTLENIFGKNAIKKVN